jgi:signal transduction histidine kinase
MAGDKARFPVTAEWSFVFLRDLTMLGGMIALFLVPLRPEHEPHLVPLAWAFVVYKAILFLTIRAWPARLRPILLGSVGLDLLFVSLFVWFSGDRSHFYLLFYLLVALAAVHFSPGIALATAGCSGVLYSFASLVGTPSAGWHHLSSRVVTFVLLGGSLGYLSQRERLARAESERLNKRLGENQARLEKADQDLQAAHERLVQSERLATIGQMSAKVSHEVRNPLSSISLNTELLEDELKALPADRRAEAATLVAAIRSQVDVLGAVTEEYLRFARLPQPRPEATALALVIEDLAQFVRGELRTRGIDLAVNVSDSLPVLHLDAGQIRQALLNLIRNAAEAMPQGGALTLSARRINPSNGQVVESSLPVNHSTTRPVDASQEWVEVAVADTGIGVPQEVRERIFEPFFTTKEDGTGLGLAIARQIVMDHGGRLACESTPGGGTTFRLILPVSEAGGNP